MKMVPYTMLIGNLNYAMLYARSSIYSVVGMVSKYQLNPGLLNLVGVKHMLKYLRRTGDYMFVHQSEYLIVTGCINTDF